MYNLKKKKLTYPDCKYTYLLDNMTYNSKINFNEIYQLF